ncbi:MAG: nuclear transport factor 2 family protein [Chloroflexota bacterium]
MTYLRLEQSFGKNAANRLADTRKPGIDGAIAALETFYYAFNNGDLDVFRQVWLPDPLIRLKNPLGGILEGIEPISALYQGIFDGPAVVWVEFWDIVVYDLGGSAALFSGRERGEFARDSTTIDLDIRTSRVFHSVAGRWGQIHHHGSITDADLLDSYRNAVNG